MKNGFTLIETLLYIALLGIMLGGVIGIYYGFAGSQAQNSVQTLVQGESNFVMQKIAWAMSGAVTINQPAAGATSTTLSVNRYDSSANPLVFDLVSNNVRLSRSGGTAQPLINPRTTVKQLEFNHLAASGNQPEGLTITLVVQATSTPSSNSSVASTTLTRIIYLRK